MYNQIIQDVDKNPTYSFQVSSIPGDKFIMPLEVKAFNLNDVRINLQDTYTTLIPHNGHEGQDGYDLTRIFDYNNSFFLCLVEHKNQRTTSHHNIYPRSIIFSNYTIITR
jgi:hypothetical protein